MYRKDASNGAASGWRNRVCTGYAPPRSASGTVWEDVGSCRNCRFCRSHIRQCSGTLFWRHTQQQAVTGSMEFVIHLLGTPVLRSVRVRKHQGCFRIRSFVKVLSTYINTTWVLDAWLYHTQLIELVNLATAFPDTQIILDHIGGTYWDRSLCPKTWCSVRGVETRNWSTIDLSNVVVKLGGLGMPLSGFGWYKQPKPPNSAELAKAMAPYYSWCINKFGSDRCMVVKAIFQLTNFHTPIPLFWNTFKRITKDFSQENKQHYCMTPATKVYRLATWFFVAEN